MPQVRVRIAPSPTGIPHLGNTRTALFNFLFARHNRGKFILRIEDTDRARLVPESEKAIYEILEWLGLLWDEKYIQSERVVIYKDYAEKLKKKKLAYEDNGALRFKVNKIGETSWVDKIGEKKITFKNETQEDFVLLKSDGFPTYNFANVIDDHLMEITHVIRGDEFISSTPKHIMLYQAFGWKPPVFAHLPVILGPDKTKLSKRHGAKSVLELRDEGYLKEALLNFMALLGWNPGGDKEIMTVDEMIKLFDLKDVNTASPIFDINKLEWMNGYYIRQLSTEELESGIRPRPETRPEGNQESGIKIKDEALFRKLVSLAQTRMKTLNDFQELIKPIIEEPVIKLTQREKEIAKKLIAGFSSIKQWNNETILAIIKKVLAEHQIKMPIIYKIVTGKASGLPLPEMLEVLGKERTIRRLEKGV